MRIAASALAALVAARLYAQVPGPELKSTAVPPIVKRAIEAAARVRFSGTRSVTMRMNGGLRTFEDIIISDGKRSRIEFPQGSPKYGEVIIENQSGRYFFHPIENEVEKLVDGPDIAKPRAQFLKHVASNSTITVGNAERVAGRLAQIVTFVGNRGNPKKDNRNLQVWIDMDTGLILKRVATSGRGETVASYELVNLNLSPKISESMFDTKFGGARFVSAEERVGRMAKKFGFEPVEIPSHFGFKSAGARMMGTGMRPIFAQAYTGDGGRLTLFRMRGKINPARLESLAKGLQVISWERNGESVALVGDIDGAKIRAVARELGGPG